MDRDRAGRFARAQAIKMGVGLADVLDATPAQIRSLVFYPREEGKDQLKVPGTLAPPPETPPSRQRDLAVLAGFRAHMRPEKYEAAQKKIEAFWDAKEAGTDG